MQASAKLMSQRNRVYSLVQNVTVEVYSKDPNLFRSRKLRRPRFSFFSSSIVKEQTRKPVKTFSHRPQVNPEPPISIAANSLGNTRAKDFVASSAAALVQ
jgi:hypothetical protein